MLPPLDPSDGHLMQSLMDIARQATSPKLDERRRAERAVAELQESVDKQTGFVVALLNIAQMTDNPASSFCSIVLKNTIKLSWNPNSAEHCIQPFDKEIIRSTIIPATLKAVPAVQRNLAEAVALVADVDFPTQWPAAIMTVAAALGTERDLTVLSTVLALAHSILAKYRSEEQRTEKGAEELAEIDRVYIPPLVDVLQYLVQALEGSQGAAASGQACVALTHAFDSIYDLLTFDFGDMFAEKKSIIAEALMRCLRLENAALMGTHYTAGCLVGLKSVAIECVTKMLNAFDEDFEKHAEGFLQIVWQTIASTQSAAAPAMDDVVVRGMELLASACSGTFKKVFNHAKVLEQLCDDVILPNMALRDDDAAAFEGDPDAYIQKDIEGSNLHTRRRAASDLFRVLMLQFPQQIQPLFVTEVDKLLRSPPSAWHAKDSLIYLVSALYVFEEQQKGVFSTHLPFITFIQSHILPELVAPVSESSPLLIKADCLRFISVFRSRLTVEQITHILPLVAAALSSPNDVVCAYAAHTLERILVLQRPATPGVGVPGSAEPAGAAAMITAEVFRPHAGPILATLCSRLAQEKVPNAYLMKCVMRVCRAQPECTKQYVGDIITSMAHVLGEAAKNPSSPLFSHCLFEVLSSCISISPADGPSIEAMLWTPLMYVLSNDVLEFVPYVLQLLAQLVEARPPGATPPDHLQSILPPLAELALYSHKGNIPAVNRLLCAFLRRYPAFVHSCGLTDKVFDVCALLVSSKQYDHEGLTLLTEMVLHYPQETMAPYMTAIYRMLIRRHQATSTNKYKRILVVFFSVLTVTLGALAVATQLNQLQAGLFDMLLNSVWLPTVRKVNGSHERKICAVALTRILAECVELHHNQELFTKATSACLYVIHGSVEKDDMNSFMPAEHKLEDLALRVGDDGFTNIFRPLQGAVAPPVDVAASVSDVDAHFRQMMRALLSGPQGGHLTEVLRVGLGPALFPYVQ